ncbi:hypothetical protein [Aquiflexum balticum]|nr:hypothetical protein [Aquiflexum balticum]
MVWKLRVFSGSGHGHQFILRYLMNIRDRLTGLFRKYIAENNPDLIVRMEGNESMKRYISDKVSTSMVLAKTLKEQGSTDTEILDTCLESMVSDLKPSKFRFVKDLMEKNFKKKYDQLTETGVLTYEIINIIENHDHLFEKHGFREKKGNNIQLESEFTAVLFDRFENT